MSNKKKRNEGPGFRAIVGGKHSLVGETVSLNLREQSYFGVGRIWLNPVNYWVEVPEDLTDQEFGFLEQGLQNGTLVMGKEYIPPVNQDQKVLERFATYLRLPKMIENEEFLSDLRETIRSRGQGGFTAQEIIQHMIRTEHSNKNRPEIVQWLQRAILMCEGQEQSIPEPDHDTPGIRVPLSN